MRSDYNTPRPADNGNPSGMSHCRSVADDRVRLFQMRLIHAIRSAELFANDIQIAGSFDSDPDVIGSDPNDCEGNVFSDPNLLAGLTRQNKHGLMLLGSVFQQLPCCTLNFTPSNVRQRPRGNENSVVRSICLLVTSSDLADPRQADGQIPQCCQSEYVIIRTTAGLATDFSQKLVEKTGDRRRPGTNSA
jgi:hypothetical protein